MQVNLNKVKQVVGYIIVIVIALTFVSVFVVQGNWRWIVLIGGVLLTLNLLFMYGFLKRNSNNSNKISKK